MIAFLIFSGRTFGGAERRFARLAAHLISRGIPVSVYCTADAWECIEGLDIDIPTQHAHLIDTPSGTNRLTNKLKRGRGLLRWFRHLPRSGIRHVHLAMNPGMIGAIYGLLARWLPRYSIAMVDATIEHWPEHAPLRNLQFRLAAGNAVAVDCLSGTLRDVAASKLARTEHLRVAPCSFTDLGRVTSAAERDIDILFMARFTGEKGLDLLARTVGRLAGTPTVHVCGSGPITPDIPQAKVYRTDDSFRTMARTKVFLSIQRYENYPSQSLLEAMGSGCAIIATDVGETRRLLDESCAVLVPYEPQALADAIMALLNDPARRVQLADAARERVTTLHSVERYGDYFLREIATV